MFKALKDGFAVCFGRRADYVFSAPGRTELSGNHTDHQHGLVLAAAVDLDMLAAVSENSLGVIRVLSEGYPMYEISLDSLSPRPEEKNGTAALIRGVAARFAALGCQLRGFDAYVVSSVLPGSGLSSSAAFEVLMGTIINHLFFGGAASAVEVAQTGQWAENNYFGKPCGLMDQTASAMGGVVAIDFADPAKPIVEKLSFDLEGYGYALYIVDTGADHAELTGEYASIPRELKSVCAILGREYLREVNEEEFYSKLPRIRESCGDRAVLRAIHVFDENRRVQLQIQALKDGNIEEFLRYVNESGLSSERLLQNITPTGYTRHQSMAFTLQLAKKLLRGSGACRVHGGGFAGTALVFMPLDMTPFFVESMEAVLGEGRCHMLSIRSEGGVLLED